MGNILLAAAEEKQHSLLIPEVSEIIWSAICVAIIAILVVKFALPKLNQILDERQSRIESGLAMAEEAKTQVADASSRAEREIAEAQQAAAKIREEASGQAKQTISAAKEKAQVEADRIIANAQRQIEAERQAAEISLRADVGMLATELAEKIVGEQLKDTELSARVIDRFLESVELSEAGAGGKGASEN